MIAKKFFAMELLYVLWPLLSIFIGQVGTSRQIGFWGAFLISLAFSPVIGLIVTMLSRTNEEVENQRKIVSNLSVKPPVTPADTTPKPQQAINPPVSIADELAKLKQLLDAGAITPEEFETAKRKILS